VYWPINININININLPRDGSLTGRCTVHHSSKIKVFEFQLLLTDEMIDNSIVEPSYKRNMNRRFSDDDDDDDSLRAAHHIGCTDLYTMTWINAFSLCQHEVNVPPYCHSHAYIIITSYNA